MSEDRKEQKRVFVSETLKSGADRAAKRKEELLEQGLFTPIPHALCRDILPELKNKYDGHTARDCVLLFFYLTSYVNGVNGSDVYMWSYPNVDQIVEDTGIHRSRIKGLVDVLISEKLLETAKIHTRGKSKKFYLPLLPTNKKAPE